MRLRLDPVPARTPCLAQPGLYSKVRCEMPLGHRYETGREEFHAGRSPRGYWKLWAAPEEEAGMTPEQVSAALAGDLPPVLLILGPGAPVLAAEACGQRGWALRQVLTADVAREVRAEAGLMAPGGLRVVALSLDHASAQVQNMLLKALEEPAPSTRFILAASVRPLPTVVSRSRLMVLGERRADQSPDPKDAAAVSTAIKAARAGQSALLTQSVRAWQAAHALLLAAWAAEAASGRWRAFSPDLAPGVRPEQALRLLAELSQCPGSRLGAQVALSRVFAQ